MEIDFTEKLWTVPASRTKMHLLHIVPLCDRALQILRNQHKIWSSQLIFAGFRDERPLSNDAMLRVLKRLGVNATVHGFRSTFRDWAGDLTRFPRDVIELALAHTVGDATERAYRRGTALEQRRELMNAWAAYCERPLEADNIIPINRLKHISA